MKIKVGIGFDVHDFVPDRPLIIGGINIPYPMGLNGHSDADVLIHAIIDSIIGITLSEDIGTIFPDTDLRYKNIDSKILLKEVYNMITTKGYKISNIDSTIIAQSPKLADYIPDMKQILSSILELDITDIGIKATTTEHLGFVGRKEGIAAVAVSLILMDNTDSLDNRNSR